jgi:uncharacterized membrane protein
MSKLNGPDGSNGAEGTHVQDSASGAPTKIITLGKTTVLNNPVDANLASALGYLPFFPLGVILAVILLRSPSDSHNFNQYNAAQSLVLGGAFFAALIANGIIGSVLGAIPLLGLLVIPVTTLLASLLGIAYWYFCLRCAWAAFQGRTYKVPYIGPVAESLIK